MFLYNQFVLNWIVSSSIVAFAVPTVFPSLVSITPVNTSQEPSVNFATASLIFPSASGLFNADKGVYPIVPSLNPPK